MDSQTLLVLTAVGALATAVFTAWPIAQRAIDRPRPRWKVERATEAQAMHKADGWLRVRLTNVGDGVAFDVILSVIGGERVELTNDRAAAPRLDSGESAEIAVRLPRPAGLEQDGYGNWPSFAPTNDMFDGVRVRVTWHHPPYRSLRRSRSYRVGRIERSTAVR